MISRCISRVAVRAVLVFLALICATTSFAKDPIVLQFTVWDGDRSLPVIKQLIATFEADNPGIKVKLEPIPDYQIYHQKMLLLYAANVPPDVAMMDMPHYQALASKDAILPLNPFMDATPGFDIKEYYKPIVDAHSYNGKLYVLPRDIAPIGCCTTTRRRVR